jgi:hypothetical protein
MSTTGAPAADDHVGSGDRLDSELKDKEMVGQRNTSTDKLLQLAQAASDSIVQIPADVLTAPLQSLGGLQNSITTLHNTVTDLQSSVIELKKENRGLQQTVSSNAKDVQLLAHDGGEFYRFAELPLEIQRLIWRHSANSSQVIAVRRGSQDEESALIPVKPHYAQLGVCKEARDEVSKVVSPLKNLLYTNTPPIFFNSSTDTLWLTTIIDATSQDTAFDDLEYLASIYDLGNRLPIKKIALPAKYWFQEMCQEGPDLIMDSLESLQTEEVILIVENNFAHQYADDIAFVQRTSYSPMVFMPYLEGWDDIKSWEDAEAAEMKCLRDFQAERAAERKAFWLGNTHFILRRSFR